MDIQLKQRIARDAKLDEFDVRQVKKALNRIGLYQPLEKLGITGIADTEMFVALKKFQTKYDLPATGIMKPGDETEKALRQETSKTPAGSYIWRTVEDDKVRGAHAAFNRTIRRWSDAPDPGEDFNCRCWAEALPYDPPIEPIYPELLLPSLAGVGRIHTLWKIWSKNQDTEWILGEFKSPTRWGNQLKDRNWTPEDITKTIKYGKKFSAPNKVYPLNQATRYEYKGRYVVRDEQTKEILQVGDPDFKRNIVE